MISRIYVMFVWYYLACLGLMYWLSHHITIRSDKILFGIPIIPAAFFTYYTFF